MQCIYFPFSNQAYLCVFSTFFFLDRTQLLLLFHGSIEKEKTSLGVFGGHWDISDQSQTQFSASHRSLFEWKLAFQYLLDFVCVLLTFLFSNIVPHALYPANKKPTAVFACWAFFHLSRFKLCRKDHITRNDHLLWLDFSLCSLSLSLSFSLFLSLLLFFSHIGLRRVVIKECL